MSATTTTSAPATHAVRISADRLGCGVRGRETLRIELPMTLDAMLQAQQLQRSGVLDGARVDADGIHLSEIYSLKGVAQRDVLRVARTLRLFAYTSMRPATPVEDVKVRALVDGMPGKRVVAAVWTHAVTGAWVAAVTAEPATGERGEWLRANDVVCLHPGWANVWAQGVIAPHLLCSDQATAAALAEGLGAIQATGPLVWTGKSETIERVAKAARAPATRSGRSMTTERHIVVVSILDQLLASRMPALALQDIRAVRRDLAARMESEHPGEDGVALYSRRVRGAPPIEGRDGQIDEIDRAVAIMEIGYGSRMRDAITRGLRRARARLKLTSAPRELAKDRKAA
jgi:hypothetical protein